MAVRRDSSANGTQETGIGDGKLVVDALGNYNYFSLTHERLSNWPKYKEKELRPKKKRPATAARRLKNGNRSQRSTASSCSVDQEKHFRCAPFRLQIQPKIEPRDLCPIKYAHSDRMVLLPNH